MSAGRIRVDVVFALPGRQVVRSVELPDGSTVGEAVAASRLAADFPEIGDAVGRVGVFGRLVPLSARLGEGDRVEIYRPLAADPKETRRKRAARQSKR